ncbi:prealbumin-like fold domain-containing protein [Elongatibacter sediminis]|uniref:DUF11 domain-containing protein n=1 Tax=Elongatibacter sediminis TaxID=3119006 RepID=A0AAW9R6E8_9GAMM
MAVPGPLTHLTPTRRVALWLAFCLMGLVTLISVSPSLQAATAADEPTTLVFEVTEEPDGIRWTVVEAGFIGITGADRNSNIPSVAEPGMSESGDDSEIVLNVAPAGSRSLVFRFTRTADTSGFRRISTHGFSTPAISRTWDGPDDQPCIPGRTSLFRNHWALKVAQGGGFAYFTQTGEPSCWAEGATALFEGSFASTGIIPGVESKVRWDGRVPLQHGLTIRTIATASLTVVLKEFPAAGTDFAFTGGLAGEPEPAAFTLDDASPDDTDTITDTHVFSHIIAGTYEVSDLLPDGWRATASCTGGGDPGVLASGVLTVAVQAREDVVCTFEHVRQAEITVVQETVPEGSQDFSFSGDLDTFILDDDADPVLANSTSAYVPAGTYAVSQTPVADFDLMSIDCGSAQAVIDQAARTATLTVETAETVTCTFRNQQRGAITIDLEALPATDQTFPFAGDLGAFILDADSADPEWPASVTFEHLMAGNHTVQENVPAGWAVSEVICDDDNSSADDASATIHLEPGERVGCRFSNHSAMTDLGMVKTAEQEPGSYDLGFHLTVTNHGPAPAENLVVTDPLQPGLIHEHNDCGGIITAEDEAETFTWSIDTLAPGEQATCTLWVIDAVQEAFVNQATFSMDQTDPEPANDSGTASVAADPREIPALSGWSALLLILAIITLTLSRSRYLG